jgi:hypothetical protein
MVKPFHIWITVLSHIIRSNGNLYYAEGFNDEKTDLQEYSQEPKRCQSG